MSRPIESYGLIGNTIGAALVGLDGSIDWLCLPRFDSDACFAALLGTPEHGRWRIAPDGESRATRRYLPGTAILETTFETPQGCARVVDFMPFSSDPQAVELVRIASGVQGRVAMSMEFVLRFGYGRDVPWVRRRDYGLSAVAGPDAVQLVTPVALRGEGLKTLGQFTLEPGVAVPFTLSYHRSHRMPPFVEDRQVLLERTAGQWREWSARCVFPEDTPAEWREAVRRSLITLKAMSHQPTGGLVAAPTTSLPERIGGVRNWDYRFCWIRDATLTLYALLNSGYFEEAAAFRLWLLRAAAGDPAQMQIMYGLAGERRLTEVELPWLPGYEGSRPVRIGNAAHGQLQLDVYGELMDVLHAARRSRLSPDEDAWHFQRALLDHLERIWREPDAGMWEVRGAPRHFTYSKMMSWVAFDRAVKAVEEFGLDGPADRWRRIREEIRGDVLANGVDHERGTFVQSYGSKTIDASLLLMAETGFVAARDPLFRGTVQAVERELMEGGFVLRYRPEVSDDGMPGSEGTFLMCSFWLVDAYVLLGRYDDARRLFGKLLSVRNDLGLLSEQYDPRSRRLLGNFPQAFSHVGLVNAVHNLVQAGGPAMQRASRDASPGPEAPTPGMHSEAEGPATRID